MPRTLNVDQLFPRFYFPSLKNYILFSAVIFFSGFYYYYRIIWTLSQVETGNNSATSEDAENNSLRNFIIITRKHRLLFYILLNSCCALVAFMGKTLAHFFFGTLSNQEESFAKKYFRRYIQTKLTFLIFISHHNLIEDILIWTPWLAIQITCLLLLELTTLRMANAYNVVSNTAARRKFLAASSTTGVSSLLMILFVFVFLKHGININYRLFLACDCCILLIQSFHIIVNLITLQDPESNLQTQQRQSRSYYLDLTYGLLRDCLEFANYLHMIFYSQLAITYCCMFLIIQAQHYYGRISTKIRKHWQQREITNHINNSYLSASEEDLLKNEQCLICWQPMKSARKLPCSHIFHEHCLRRWLEQDSSCAVCRKSLALNLNNLRQQQNIERDGDDINQAMHMIIAAFSPQNSRVTRWWSRFIFDSMNEEQISIMVNQVSEMFPQISREFIRQLINDTGSMQATVEMLLERDAQMQNNLDNRLQEQPNIINDENLSDESFASTEEEGDSEIEETPMNQEFSIKQPHQPNSIIKTRNEWLNQQMEKMLMANKKKYINRQKSTNYEK